MELRKFNDAGIQKFEIILDDARNGEIIARESALEILQDKTFSDVVCGDVFVAETAFNNRFDAGKYFYELFGNKSGVDFRNKGMWAWLSLFFFSEVCSKVGEKIGRNERYIPDFAYWRHYYRHLLSGPFSIYRAHQKNPQCAMCVLRSPVHAPGDIVESLASRQELISSPTIMGAATKLFVDKNGEYKRGAARKKEKPGARRFAILMGQFDFTYNLYNMNVDRLIKLLPPEFDEFRD